MNENIPNEESKKELEKVRKILDERPKVIKGLNIHKGHQVQIMLVMSHDDLVLKNRDVITRLKKQ